MAIEPPSTATKLLVVALTLALIAYPDRVANWLQGWDTIFFWLIVGLFIAISRVGTKIVIRIAAEGGELPANDEMFNFPEFSVDNPNAAPQQPVSPEVARRRASWWPSQLRWRRAAPAA